MAAVHQSIVGGRFRISSDQTLSASVSGGDSSIVSPSLVWDVAIGQSTQITESAIANLQYRDLTFHHFPQIGDTLSTATTVTGIKSVSQKNNRPPRGIVEMQIKTVDQNRRTILDFSRRAMLPADPLPKKIDLGTFCNSKAKLSLSQYRDITVDWKLGAYRDRTSGSNFLDIEIGRKYQIIGGDVVSSAPELARLTMNLASIHHDSTNVPSGKRLVYGGHTIGLATAQATRAFPSLVTILGWHSCDHLAPVFEGDTLHSTISVENVESRNPDGGFVHLNTVMTATSHGGEPREVLAWRFVGLFA
jgi:acyl dehydratase